MARQKQFNPQSFGTRATLLFCTVDSTALGAVITPILAVMALSFPSENVNLLVALPPLFIIPTSVITGRLAYYVSRKTLLTVGQILYIIGGVGAAWFSDFNLILVMRVILGIGCGIVYPIIPTLIAQFYGGHERAKMMGAANAVGSIIAMGMSLLAGMLATIGWHLPFYVDLFFVVVLVMQLIFLPRVPPEKDMPQLKQAQATLTAAQKRISGKAWLCILLMFVTMTMGMVYLLKIAMILQERGLGDSALAGLLNSTQILCAFIFALSFPFVLRVVKRWTVVIPVAGVLLSFFFTSIAYSIPLIFLACGIFGIYLGFLIPYTQTTISSYTHPVRRTFALSLLSCAMFAGQACATPFVGLMESFLGSDTSALFSTMAIIMFVLLMIVCAYMAITQKTATIPPYAEITEFDKIEQKFESAN
jgi:MFS family permease